MFYIMEFCEGNVHWESSLEDISSNQLRAKMYDEMSRVMAAIHSVDLDKVGLSDYGRPGNYFQRQYDRWSSQYKASELKPIPEMDQVIEWLGKNIPEDDGRVSLVHGDYRLDNLMFSSDNERVIAVLDWELSTLGHPYADLAYQCMGMRLPSGNGPGASSGLLGIDSDALGIPSEKDYIASYCQRMGIDKLDNWNFYLAFSFFRLAAIAQGVAKRAADGNASSKAAGGIATMVQPIAANALAIINEQ
jgi:aminoglycoside phosphotransferase (APT) family kinase protein